MPWRLPSETQLPNRNALEQEKMMQKTLKQSLEGLARSIHSPTRPVGTPLTYVARHGREFNSKALTQAELDFVYQVDWNKYTENNCYHNSQMAAIELPTNTGINLAYVEGYLRINYGREIEHAWLSINGKVVDLTIRTEQNPGRVMGVIPEGWEYFGVEMNPIECLHCLTHGATVPLIDDWECGWPFLQRRYEDGINRPDQDARTQESSDAAG